MSSDCFIVDVVSVEGRVVLFESRPTTAGGLTDKCFTRSFVLCLFYNAGAAVDGPYTDESWVRDHVGRYVERTEVLSVTGLDDDGEIRRVAALYELPLSALQPALRIRATLATAALAAHFKAGQRFGTTAWDVWWNDPLRPALPETTPPSIDHGPAPDDWFERLVAAFREALPAGWTAQGPAGAVRALRDLTWTLSLRVEPQWVPYQPRANVHAHLEATAPALEARRAAGRKASPPIALIQGDLEQSAPQSSYWSPRLVEGGRESVEALGRRLAAQLARVDGALTMASGRDDVLARIEASCALSATREKVKSFAPLRSEAPAEVAEGLLLNVAGAAQDRFWRRAAFLRVFGDEAAARAAFAQASSRWKRPPKELAPLVEGL